MRSITETIVQGLFSVAIVNHLKNEKQVLYGNYMLKGLVEGI